MMSEQILLGTVAGSKDPLSIDLPLLLSTRLLVQASSGGGKSWALRRLAEQLFGKVQVILIDPEGEFATLREHFGYVLVGKGGETPADTRSAALVATKLLELNASAVCDLYEMKPSDRHQWVSLFLDALIDAPKRLWHPVVVIVDEAHTFAPERGAGESVAADAVIAMATRGRKRAYALVLATQRLGKLRKDVAAECGNVLIGRAVLDVDRDRAADALGISKADKAAFSAELKLLGDGQFYALGRAICDTRTLVKVGPVATTHHGPGTTAQAADPPPAPAKIKHLLPSLADLPKEAEQEAKTAAELRTENARLKRELAAKPLTLAPPAPKVERVEVPVLTEAMAKRMEATVEKLERCAGAMLEVAREVAAAARNGHDRAKAAQAEVQRRVTPAAVPVQSRTNPPAAPLERRERPVPAADGAGLTGPEQRILNALAELEDIGFRQPDKVQLALFCGYTNARSGGFSEPLARLVSAGLALYPERGAVAITDTGRDLAYPPASPLTSAELQERILGHLDGPPSKILRELLAIYPSSIDKAELGIRLGYANPRSGGFSEPLGYLRSLRLIDYPRPGKVLARSVLFLEG